MNYEIKDYDKMNKVLLRDDKMHGYFGTHESAKQKIIKEETMYQIMTEKFDIKIIKSIIDKKAVDGATYPSNHISSSDLKDRRVLDFGTHFILEDKMNYTIYNFKKLKKDDTLVKVNLSYFNNVTNAIEEIVSLTKGDNKRKAELLLAKSIEFMNKVQAV